MTLDRPDRSIYAERAVRAHGAMERSFATTGVLMRRDGRCVTPWARAHLWPFIRAFVATIDVAGIPEELRPQFDPVAAIARREEALEHYWDARGPAPGYASDVGRRWWGGDRYHDDNAWVGLALVGLERQHPASGRVARAAQLWRFAQSGWHRGADGPMPGGVFWVEQSRGIGQRNHDRNTVSTAPNAQLALHLAELSDPDRSAGGPQPQEMIDWVQRALSHDGLYWDKIRGDGSIDRAVWSYNQGSMIGAHVLLHRAAVTSGAGAGDEEGDGHLAQAEAIARRSLTYLSERMDSQPAAFHAIWFRNLLLLHHATADASLQTTIAETMRGWADHVWHRFRGPDELFRMPCSHGRVTLLDQSAMVQILALLAWAPDGYALIT
jgi:hypothetical protein